jgi:hypothetical protein
MQKVDTFLAVALFGGAGIADEQLDDVTLDEWDEALEQPLQRFLEQSQLEHALAKGPPSDLGWDEQFTPPPRTFSKAFEQRSAARLEKVNRLVRKAFAGHPELAEEAIAVVKQIRDYARASVTGDAVPEPLATHAPIQKSDGWWKEGQLVRTSTRFAKGTNGFRMGVARTEERIINNVRWILAFNAAGELLDCQQINEQERAEAQIA